MGRRLLVGFAIGVVVIVLAAASLLCRSEKPFHDYVAKLRVEGSPATFDALLGPMPTDAENAATEIESACDSSEAEFGAPGEWPCGAWEWESFPERGEIELTPGQREALTDFADRAQPFVLRVAAALARPRCRFALRFDPVFGLKSRARHVASSTRSLLDDVARHARDVRARFDACHALALLAARLESRGFEETWIAMAAADRCVRALRAGVEDGTFSPSLARETLDPLLRGAWLPRISASCRFAATETVFLYGELLAGRWTVAPRLGERAAHEAQDLWGRLKGERVERRFEPGHAEWVVGLCGFARDVASIGADSYIRFCRDYRTLAAQSGVETEETGGLLNAAEWLALADAETRLARVALAMAEHRAKHDDFPATLDELRPMFDGDVPLDPYTDAPFVYEKTGAVVRLSSVGRLLDDGPLSDATLRERVLVWELRR